MKDKLYIGYICGTHGIKGELKVLSDFEKKDQAFMVNNKTYDNKCYKSSK